MRTVTLDVVLSRASIIGFQAALPALVLECTYANANSGRKSFMICIHEHLEAGDSIENTSLFFRHSHLLLRTGDFESTLRCEDACIRILLFY